MDNPHTDEYVSHMSKRIWGDGIENPKPGDRVHLFNNAFFNGGYGTVSDYDYWPGRDYFVRMDDGRGLRVSQHFIEWAHPDSVGVHTHTWTHTDSYGNTRCRTCGAFQRDSDNG